MMKKILMMIFILSAGMMGQSKLMLSFNPGMSLYNSENSMLTIGDKSIGWFPGISLRYEKNNVSGLSYQIEYCFAYSKTTDVLDFPETNIGNGTILYTLGADLTLTEHNIDADLVYHIAEALSVSGGPTVALVYRSLEVDNIPTQTNLQKSLDDRLASLCLGVNCSINVELPLDDNPQYLFLFSSINARYLHSVYFDKRGRDLDDYYQSFLSGQVNIGLGYCF